MEENGVGSGTNAASEMEMVQEAGGLDAFIERILARQEERTETSNRRLLTEFLESTDKKSEARTKASEDRLRKEFGDMHVSMREEVGKLTKIVDDMQKQDPKPASGAAGKHGKSEASVASQFDHKIKKGDSSSTFRDRDPATLLFTGREDVDKADALDALVKALEVIGVDKKEFTFNGPARGNRFWVKFKRGALHYENPSEAAQHVKKSFKPKEEDGTWATVEVKRKADELVFEYEFNYDSSSNQVIKELITKGIYKHVKDKDGGKEFKAFRKDGTIYKNFKCVAKVLVGYKADSFQVQWWDPQAFTAVG